MKKTKIICTMGPNTNDRDLMKALALHGMDVARFNFSHGDYEEQKMRLDMLKSIREETGLPIAALLDTKGPEIRTGLLKDGKKVTLEAGQTYTLTTREIVGDNQIAHINYSGLNEDVAEGNRILIDDGLIELKVQEVNDTDIVCQVINGGELGEKKGVNVPNVKIKLPALPIRIRQIFVLVLSRALILLLHPLYVQQMQFVRFVKFWMRLVLLFRLLPRSKMQRELRIWMRLLKPVTVLW